MIKQKVPYHAQSVKMALTEDLTQKQHTFGECTLHVSYYAGLFCSVLRSLFRFLFCSVFRFSAKAQNLRSTVEEAV